MSITPMASRSETLSKQKRPIIFSGMNVNQVKLKLAAQLDDKEKLLEKAGTSQISRNAFLKQRDVIRKEIQQLNRYSQDDELPTEIRSRLEDLANEFQFLKSSEQSMLDDSAAKNNNFSPLLPPPPTNSSPTKQRSKALNGNKRSPDIEFATEIGQGLLIEVRKLQIILQEKEETIKQLELAKTDNERSQETSQRHLRQREEAEERLKEENWNLEVANQELRTHLLETNQTAAKHNSDYSRLVKQLKTRSEQIDIMKAQEEKSASVIEAMKARHEQETHQLRRHAANAQRESAQVQKELEARSTELKIVQAKLAIKLATSTRTAIDESNQSETNLDVQEDHDPSENDQNKNAPTTAAAAPRSQQALETETLKQSLAHAHRIISNLRSSYHKEKLEKFEIKKMLSDSQENIEQLRKEMVSWNSNNANGSGNHHGGGRGGNKANGKKKLITKKKRGGVARQPRGLSLNESDSDQSVNSNKLEEVNEDEEETTDEYDSMNEDTLDQHFSSFGNSFGGFNNNASFASITMKPLSSELEANKVQVIDAGMNTEPIEYIPGPCVHGFIGQHEQLPSSTVINIQQDSSNPRCCDSPSSFVAQQQQVGNQEAFNKNNDTQQQQLESHPERDSSKQSIIPDSSATFVSPARLLDNNDITSINHISITAAVNQEYVQAQVTKAVVKERNDIAERASSILSPEQIETVVFVSSTAASAHSTITQNRDIPTNLVVAADNHGEVEEKMISQKQVDQLIQSALEKEISTMVPKSEVEKLIQEAVVSEQEKVESMNLIPKAEAERLVEEAIASEQRNAAASLIPKEEADKLVQEAVKSEQEKVVALNLIPKSEADKLVEQAIASEQEKVVSLNLIPKSEADKLIEQAIASEQEKVVSLDLIPKIEAVRLVEQAIASEQEKVVSLNLIPKSEADKLVEHAIASEQEKVVSLNLIPKIEAVRLVEQAIASEQEKVVSLNLIPKIEADKLVEQAIASEKEKAASLNLISKSEADKVIAKTVEEVTKKMQVNADVLVQETRAQMDAQFQMTQKELLSNMIPKVEAEALALEAVALANEKLKNEKKAEERESTTLKNVSPSPPTEDMITKKDAEELVKQALASEQVKILQALDKQKAEVEAAASEVHKKELEAHLEKQKLDMEAIKQAEIEKHLTELEAIKQSELEKQKVEIEAAKQAELEKQLAELEVIKRFELEKQKIEIEAAKHAELEQQKAEIEAANLTELEKHKTDSEVTKLAEMEQQKLDIQNAKQVALDQQKMDIENAKQAELEQQRMEIESAKQAELEQQKMDFEKAKQVELERQKMDFENAKQVELERQKMDFEKAKQVELERQKMDIEEAKQAELEKQKLEVEAMIRAELEKQIADIEVTKQSLEKQREKASAELVLLTKSIAAYKKESEETNQRMITMLTKDSVDVLVKRAIADALEKAEKNQAEILAGMISREYALVMVKDEVSKALELERKEAAQREEAEAMQMISKAEAEALAKVAAADAIVKERQAMAAREKELVSKEEAEILATAAVREAVDKERSESALVLARERKLLREKEERMITKEEAEEKTKEAVRLALLESSNSKKTIPEITTTSHLNNNDQQQRSLETPIPSKYMGKVGESSSSANAPPTNIERSVSTSRLAPPTLNVSPSPSVSTPASSSSRKLRLSSSVSSFRFGGSGRKENTIQKNQRLSTDSTAPTASSFGSFRILENSKYAPRLQSKSSISLRDLSQKQDSATSIYTMSSDEGHQGAPGSSSRLHMPMNSEDSFPGFASGAGTDMQVISAITQTMIGEWMFKHTRRHVGGGISENKHQRFFWVHPYTKILYWSSARPGAEGTEAKTKSAFIESVSTVPSHDNTGASPMSLLIRTPKRDLKLTAPSIERHEMWFKSLTYLLGRPDNATNQLIEEPRLTTESSATGIDTISHRQTTFSTKASSVRSIPHAQDILQYDSDESEDLVNIRQCCDGKHDVSTLSKHHNHHHS